MHLSQEDSTVNVKHGDSVCVPLMLILGGINPDYQLGDWWLVDGILPAMHANGIEDQLSDTNVPLSVY